MKAPAPTPRKTPAPPEPRGWRAFFARPRLAVVGDYARRVFNGLAEDNAFFLAGGVAFSLLLALVPFVLLLVVGLTFAFGREPQQAAETVMAITETFLPRNAFEAGAVLRTMVDDVLRTRGAVGITAALGFIWTSTRLFGSLRAVLSIVMDRDERGIVAGKLFDVVAAAAATLLVVIWVVIATFLSIGTERGTGMLSSIGVQMATIGTMTHFAGRLIGLAVLVFTFYALYRGLPRRRPSREAALLASVVAATLFELARHLFAMVISLISPGSLYTGTIAVIVSVVFWMYYGALVFLLGAEIAQVHELRRQELARLAEPRGASRKSRAIQSAT